MFNLLQPTQGGSVEKVLGLFVCLILIGLLAFFQYKKCDSVIKSRYSNGLIIGYSVAGICATLFCILGSNIILTSEPNIGLIVVAVFMVILPSIGAVYTAFVPILAIVKTLLKQVKMNYPAMIFSCLAIICAITSVVMLIVVF